MEEMDFRRGTSGGHRLIRLRAKTIAGRSWQPKTKVDRAVPISHALRQHLDRYMPLATTSPEIGQDFPGWYFPAPTSAHWDLDNFARNLRQANKDTNLHWSCLDYRHSFGSQLAQRGVSRYKISSLMGNSPEICPRHHRRVYYPCCGSGSMFDQSEKSVKPHGDRRTDVSIFGQESDRTTWRLAQMKHS